MLSRKVALALLALTACSPLAAGCVAESEVDDQESTTGGGDGTSEDAIVSERQLMGNELPQGTVALTFDDGPGGRSAELAEWLTARNIPATFFINGKNVPGHQMAIDKIVSGGHILANHTQNHEQMTKQAGGALYHAVADTDAIIKQAQPAGPFLLRAPFGAWNGRVAGELNGGDMKKYVGSVFWDIGGELTATTAADWACWGQKVSVERCADLYLNEVHTRKKGIILMHDVHNKTVDMVKIIVPKLQQDGYRFAKLTDVPAVKRALDANAAPPPAGGGKTCFRSTTGTNVAENGCVQSRRDQKWYRCEDGEWAASSATDAKCTSKKAL